MYNYFNNLYIYNIVFIWEWCISPGCISPFFESMWRIKKCGISPSQKLLYKINK